MYFYFEKNALFMLLIVLMIAGIPCLVDNVRQGRAGEWGSQDEVNHLSLMTSVGGYGKDLQVAWWQGLLHSVAALVLVLELICFKIFLNRRAQQMDLDNMRSSHFTVWVKNLKQTFDKDKLGEFLQQYGRKDGEFAEVYSINVAYDIEDYISLGLHEHQLMGRQLYLQQFQYSLDGPPATGCCCCRRVPSLQDIEQELLSVKAKMQEREQKFQGSAAELQTQQAFVTFLKQTDARATIKNWKRSRVSIFCQWMCQCFSKQPVHFDGSYITVAPAPEPSDIIWENLNVGSVYRLYRRVVSMVLMLLTIAAGFVGLSALKYYQRSLHQDTERSAWVISGFSFLLSIAIIIINKALFVLARLLTNSEKHQTWTNYYLSIFYKLVLLLTLNTTIMLILLNSWQHDIFNDKTAWFAPNGLISDVMNLTYTECLMDSLMYLLSPLWIKKLLLRWSLERRAEKEVLPYTQKQLNEYSPHRLFEALPVDLAQRYANIAQVLFMAFVFAPMCPLVLPFSCLALFINYWTDKIMLLRRHSRPRLLGLHLSESVMLWTPVWIFTYAAFNFALSYLLNEANYLAPACGLGVAVLYWVTPFKRCMRKTPVTRQEMEKLILPKYFDDYIESAPTFLEDYERVNPVTSQTGWVKWLALVESQLGKSKRSDWDTYSRFQSNRSGQLSDQVREYVARTSALEATYRTLSGQKFPFLPLSRPKYQKPSAPQL